MPSLASWIGLVKKSKSALAPVPFTCTCGCYGQVERLCFVLAGGSSRVPWTLRMLCVLGDQAGVSAQRTSSQSLGFARPRELPLWCGDGGVGLSCLSSPSRWSVVYYLVRRRWALLHKHPCCAAAAYGLVLYGVMRLHRAATFSGGKRVFGRRALDRLEHCGPYGFDRHSDRIFYESCNQHDATSGNNLSCGEATQKAGVGDTAAQRKRADWRPLCARRAAAPLSSHKKHKRHNPTNGSWWDSILSARVSFSTASLFFNSPSKTRLPLCGDIVVARGRQRSGPGPHNSRPTFRPIRLKTLIDQKSKMIY